MRQASSLLLRTREFGFREEKSPKGLSFGAQKSSLHSELLRVSMSSIMIFMMRKTAWHSAAFCDEWLSGSIQAESMSSSLTMPGFTKHKPLRNLLTEFKIEMTFEYIPPYSPELNPIETCWKVTKNAVTKSQYHPTIESMQNALETFWEEHVFTQNFITYLCR